MKRLLVLALLAGCAAQPSPATDPFQNPEAMAPLTCPSKTVCDLYWQRAQAWVAQNSAYRVRAATDTLIETYGPFGAKVDLAYQIVRTPDAVGGARITIQANCDNVFRCYPGRGEAIAAFKRFVKQP